MSLFPSISSSLRACSSLSLLTLFSPGFPTSPPVPPYLYVSALSSLSFIFLPFPSFFLFFSHLFSVPSVLSVPSCSLFSLLPFFFFPFFPPILSLFLSHLIVLKYTHDPAEQEVKFSQKLLHFLFIIVEKVILFYIKNLSSSGCQRGVSFFPAVWT